MVEAREVNGGGRLAWSVLLLVVLYLLQGIPVGLALGAVSFLLKQSMSYAEVAVFSFAAWPYALKLLWSPVVDGIFSERFGRRRSWIVPVQLCLGLTLIYISTWIDCYLPFEECKTQGPRPAARSVYFITFWFFLLVFLSATQDIAVDGWALELLPESRRELSSTCQTIGLSGGFFLSFTVLLALSSREFTNHYLPFFRDPPMTISGYIRTAGIVSCLVMVVVLFVPEAPPKEKLDLKDVYRRLILAMQEQRSLLAVLLIHKIGFVANDAAAGLFLIEQGLRREDFAVAALLDFPLQILVGVFVASWSKKTNPTSPWRVGQFIRLCMCLLTTSLLYYMHVQRISLTKSTLLVAAVTILNNISSTIMFVSQGALFASISDSSIGGTYQTLLNTVRERNHPHSTSKLGNIGNKPSTEKHCLCLSRIHLTTNTSGTSRVCVWQHDR